MYEAVIVYAVGPPYHVVVTIKAQHGGRVWVIVAVSVVQGVDHGARRVQGHTGSYAGGGGAVAADNRTVR
jgi:hypothetical protein